jgi:hypothetical protein
MNTDAKITAYGNCHLKPDFRLYKMLTSSHDLDNETRVLITNTNKEQTQYLN